MWTPSRATPRRAGFEYSVCSSYFAYYDDMDAGNQEMLEKIAGRPRLLGSPVVSPTHLEASIRWLDEFAANDRLAHATITPDTVLDRGGSEGFMALFAEAAKRGVPIFYNGPNWDFTRLPRYPTGVGYAPFVRGGRASDLAMFREIGRRHPDLPVIIGHGLGEDGIRLAAETPNVYLELSGSYPNRGGAEAGHRHRRRRPDRVRDRHGPDSARLRTRHLPGRRPCRPRRTAC